MVGQARGGAVARLIAGVAVAVLVAGACSDDDAGLDEEGNPEATLSAPETPPPPQLEATVPGGTLPGEDGSTFVDDALADGTVTAEELTAAYDGFLACLADGGGTGRYAYDVELRTGLAVDWSTEDDGVDRALLDTSCSRRYLGGLARRFEIDNPPPDDLAGRQRANLTACIERVSPTAAANLPAQIAVGTAGEASSLGELQLDPGSLDPDSLGADADDISAVADCIASLGAEWRAFG
jgi:hypothetical protein